MIDDRVRLVREYAGSRRYGSGALFSVAVSDRLVPMPLRGSSTCGLDARLLLDSSFVPLARDTLEAADARLGWNLPGSLHVVGGVRATGTAVPIPPMQGGGLSTAATSPERLRDELVRLVHRGADVRGFSFGAARILARAVPFDGVCVLTMDPAMLLLTGAVLENGRQQQAGANARGQWQDLLQGRATHVRDHEAGLLESGAPGA